MNYKIGALFSMLLLLVGCQSTSTFDYDESINFSEVKTYAWVIGSKPVTDDPEYFNSAINNKRIANAIERNLEDKGLRKVAPNEADVLVNYHVSVNKKRERALANTHPAYWNFGRGYHRSRLSGHINFNHVLRNYKEGALIIDFLNPQKQLIWRGSDETRLNEKSSPKKRLEKVNKVVSQILLNFKSAL